MRKMFFIIIVCLSLVSSVAARSEPSCSFLCDIDVSEIPQGAIYVDMLFPLEETHERYCEYNQDAGEKNGILQDSEIVRYEKGGFKSYTFHIQGSRSEMKPYKATDEVYYVSFFEDKSGYDEQMFYEIDDFGGEYKTVKFAYLNATGDIIAETNKVDIWNNSGYRDIYISISGEFAECVMPKNFSFPFGFFLRLILLLLTGYFVWIILRGAVTLINKSYTENEENNLQ